MNQWPGVKLRVTQSWHEGNQYAGESLHYEGRAVDITTNDRDRSKLGMLARLAVEAGFDWVYYESRVWIHCSVKSEKSESARNGGCFDETSVVYSRSGGPKPIKDVSVGEELLTMAADGLSYAYSPVLMFLDRDPSVERLYYHIETSSGAKITATASHLLFVAEGLNEDEEKDSILVSATTTTTTTTQPQFAKDIALGQYLYTLRREGDQLVDRSTQSATLEKVVKISTSLSRGAYAPLTMTGNLVVNNITASCYAVINSQRLAHLSFAPVRWAHSFTELGDRLSRFLLHTSSSSSSFTRRAANSNSASASVAESANSIASPMQENSSKGGTGVH
ncbi:PREDICTED: sonic hedgehog protein-like, partial [Rhagoletis zephyria]|uniref:sonic hedgehog protein-like n=1 Tax=Rhagoletis zephyria TaxID=28612 RepID=UPI00081125EC